jgi:hypothetical protein
MPTAIIIWLINDLVAVLTFFALVLLFLATACGGLMVLYGHDLLPLTRGFERKKEVKEAKHQVQLTRLRNLENIEMDKMLTIGRGSTDGE